jgi:hypothetical protein
MTINAKALYALARNYALRIYVGTTYEAEVWLDVQGITEQGSAVIAIIASFKDERFNLPSGNHIAMVITFDTIKRTALDLEDTVNQEARDWHLRFSEMIGALRATAETER